MHNEQIFTPNRIVLRMLENVGYTNDDNMLNKHIIDNSCGDGAFLKEIVRIYLNRCITNGVSKDEAKRGLETYIHGIEIDSNLCVQTIDNLNEIAVKYSITDVKWDIVNVDTMDVHQYDGMMDYVIGNPPYCNVHHMKDIYDKVKKFKFSVDGMTDLYLVFFEIGIRMLNGNGILSYITPNSWLTSVDGKNFRKYLLETKQLKSVIQYGHEQIFSNATTFCAVTTLAKNHRTDYFDLYENDKEIRLNLKECYFNERFYLVEPNVLSLVKDILEYNDEKKKIFHVKNGFATLNDKMFLMKDTSFMDYVFDRNILKTIKASKGEECYMIFPYTESGKPLCFDELSDLVRTRLLEFAEQNGIDTNKENWYLYGRTQGLKDIFKQRVSVNNLIRNKDDLKIRTLLPDYGIYSGFYVYSDEFIVNEHMIKEMLYTELFETFVKALGKHKNGGYYTFSSKDLEKFLNFIGKI